MGFTSPRSKRVIIIMKLFLNTAPSVFTIIAQDMHLFISVAMSCSPLLKLVPRAFLRQGEDGGLFLAEEAQRTSLAS